MLETKKSEWKHWRIGWGQSRRLSADIELIVGRGMGSGDKFYWACLGRRTQPHYETLEDAKLACETHASIQLAEALAQLS